MNDTSKLEYLIKGIVLLILDIITFLLVFSFWTLLNFPVFLWSSSAILLTLMMLNGVILTSRYFIKSFGVGVYSSLLASTLLYYLSTMVFTGATYILIAPKRYVLLFLLITLVYILVVFGLFVSGVTKNQDLVRKEKEKEKMLDLNLLLFRINDNLRKSKDYVDELCYFELSNAYTEMEERIRRSTPFGSTGKPVIENLETKILTKLQEINESISSLQYLEEKVGKDKSIVDALNDVKIFTINREKLNIQ